MTDGEPLDREIDELLKALATAPHDHPGRVRQLVMLALALLERFERTGNLGDLQMAVAKLSAAGTAVGVLDGAGFADVRKVVAQVREPASKLLAPGGLNVFLDDANVELDDLDRAGSELHVWADQVDEAISQALHVASDVDGRDAILAATEKAERATQQLADAAEVLRAHAAHTPGLPGRDVSASYRLAEASVAPRNAVEADEVGLAHARSASSSPDRARPAKLEFTAAYRREIEWEKSYQVLFFVLRPQDRARVQEIISQRATALLGGVPTVVNGPAAREVISGIVLTIAPVVLGATFSPSYIDVVVGDEVRELTFDMTTAPRSDQTATLGGYIDISIGSLIVSQVPIAFEVKDAVKRPILPERPGVPEFPQVANAETVSTVFVSYSHKDSDVVDPFVQAYQAAGINVLIDHQQLRAGDEWRAELQRMIGEANVFLLYWSKAAAASQEVENEWRQALTLSPGRDRFIRPLYWELPRPDPPPELSNLHFAKLDLDALRRAAKPHPPGGSRRCDKCGQTKPMSDFGWSPNKNRPNKWCTQCHESYRLERSK